MTREETIRNLEIIKIAFVKPVTKEQRNLIDDTIDMAISALSENKGDLISRQAVENITWEEPSYTDPLNVLTEVREKVRALPSAENKGEWVPVSERLPEERTAVLVYVPEWKNIYCAYYEPKNEQWWIFGTYTKLDFEVVAWQPLPEPYKAESEMN